MIVFDYLPAHELIKISSLNPRFADIILNHYIIRQFRLNDDQVTSSIYVSNYRLSYPDGEYTRVHITNSLNETLQGLELFGRFFKHICYEMMDFEMPSWQKLFESVERNCVNARKSIHIRSVPKTPKIDSSWDNNWTYSFDHTTTQVTLVGHFYDQIILSKMFPFLQQLTVEKLRKSIIQHYPHLTNLSIIALDEDETNANIRELLRLNPQLRHFHTATYNDAIFMTYLNEVLPNLESLSFKMNIEPQIDHEIIHFNSVKDFSLEINSIRPMNSYRQVIGNITFSQLETLTLKTFGSITLVPELIRVFSQYTNLKKLDMNMLMTPDELLSFIQVMPILEEVSFSLSQNNMINVLAALLSDNQRLEKVHVYSRYSNWTVSKFAEITPAAWQFFTNKYGSTFTRRIYRNSN